MIAGIWTGIHHKLSLPEAFRLLVEDGWKAFEISTEHLAMIEADPDPERRIEEARACIDDMKLFVPQSHPHLVADVAGRNEEERQRDIRVLLSHIHISARLGVKNVVIHPGGKPMAYTREDWRRIRDFNVEAFRRLGDAAAVHDIRIGLENLNRRGAALPAELLELVEAINHPAIGITFDTSHANLVGLNLGDAIRDFGPLLVATHISDNDGSADQHRIPGYGVIDWPAVVSALRDAGYAGLFNLEIPGARHPHPDLHRMKIRHARDVTDWLLR